MLLRIKQVRAGGTRVELGKGKGKRVYHFKPMHPQKPDEEHVCDINEQEDIATLLAIKEGYEIHASELKGARVKPAAATDPKSNPEADPAPADKPLAGDAADAADAADADKGKATGGSPAPDYTKMDKPELLKRVEKKTGKKPHPSTGTAKLIAALQAA